jgi:predicted porin
MGGGSDARVDNVVAYVSPSFGGFAFAAAYSTDPFSTAQVTTRNPLTGDIRAITNVQNAGDDSDGGVYNLNATYTNGPIYVGLAYGDGDGQELLGRARIRAAGRPSAASRWSASTTA